MVNASGKMIAIKDFEMPRNCVSCPFYVSHSDTEDNCRITGEGLYDVKIGERHEKCPLLEENSEKTEHRINNDGHYDDDTINDEFFILFFIAFLCCFLFYITKF